MKTLFIAFAIIALVQFSVAAPAEKQAEEQQDLGFGFSGGFNTPIGGASGGFGWSEESMKQLTKEQQLQFGALLGGLAQLAPQLIQAAPGILNGVSGIVGAARGREQELGSSGPLFRNGNFREQDQ